MASGPERRAIPCPLCNEKFFPASLPFHQKQCAKRRGQRVVPCPYCDKQVIQLDLPEHIKTCPKGAGRQVGSKQGARSSSSSAALCRPCNSGGEQAEVPPGEAAFEPQVLDDGRMGCLYCGRFFNPDRIYKHQQICGKLQNARPKGVDGAVTQAPAKVFNSAAQRGGGGPCFMSQNAFKQKQEAHEKALAREKKRNGSREPAWRRAHEEFQQICKQARGESVPAPTATSRPPASNMVTCPHCSRQFSRDAAERHIPICANVRNRPKPPPSPSPPTRSGRADSPMRSTSTLRRKANSSSPGPSVRTLRPGEGDDPLSPNPREATYQINDSAGAPQRRTSGRSSSCSRLPSADGGSSAGGALRAARDIRRNNSSDKLPQLHSPASDTGDSRSPQMNRSSSGSATWVRKPPTVPKQRSLDATAKSEDRSAAIDDTMASTAVSRVGMRRCAMMYRLLSQVPQDILARELADCGVEEAIELDKEGLIEAIIDQLA